MKQRYAGMYFDREVPVRRCEKSSFGNTNQFGKELLLCVAFAHMLNDGVGVAYIERVILKRESPPISDDGMNFRILLAEVTQAFVSNGGNVFRESVVLFKVVIGRGVLRIVDAHIDNGLRFFWFYDLKKESKLPRPVLLGN